MIKLMIILENKHKNTKKFYKSTKVMSLKVN